MHGAGMTRRPSRRARAGWPRPPVGLAASLAVALALAGCAWLPDWADPVAAYRAVVGDDVPPAHDDGEPRAAEAGEASYPNLASVPDQAPATSSAADRRQIVEGLVADRRNARHTGAADQAAAPAPPPTPPSTAEAAPPPAAAPGRIGVPSIVQGGPRPIVPPPAGAPRPRSVAPASAAVPPSASEPPPAPQAAAPAAPVVVLQPPPTAASPPPPPRDDFTTVAQVFAARIAESGPAVTTAPAHLRLPAPPADEPPSPVAEAEAGPDAAASAAAASAAPRPVGADAGEPVIVYFANGSSRVAARERAKVAEIVRRYAAGGGAVRIVGHASSRTLNLPIDRHKLVNLWISMDRAEAVARELVRQGVPPGAIAVEARADNEPRFFESMPAAEASNRRAEVYLEF